MLLLLAAAGGLYAALYSDTGRDFLRKEIEAAVSEEDGLSLALGPIDGDLLSDFQIARVVLADPEGEWLVAEDLSVSWSPFDLLDERLSIASITLSSLELLREPVLPPSEEEVQSQEPALPSLPGRYCPRPVADRADQTGGSACGPGSHLRFCASPQRAQQ